MTQKAIDVKSIGERKKPLTWDTFVSKCTPEAADWIFRTIRPLVPVDSGHLFRVIAAGVGAKRRWSYFH
jgi:hypothetical protein